MTDFNPLTIWMYKDCYLRFCTQQFTLDNTQLSVHLCNYSIQKNFKNDTERNAELPEENMWSNEEFVQKYLARMNRKEAWEEIIYPGMKNAILCSMLSTQDIIESRKNTFELYGADFMIGEDLKPWLIEINCSPTMARSTQITTLLCDNVQEDICKVIIDRKTNKNADTGKFELVYKASQVTAPNYLGIDLKIDGHSYKKSNQIIQQQNQLEKQQVQSTEKLDKIDKQPEKAPSEIKQPESKPIESNPVKVVNKISSEEVSTGNFDRTRTSNGLTAKFTNSTPTNFIQPAPYNKVKKELTYAPISIATSIHELTHKEMQAQSHLANYNLLNSNSQSKIMQSNLSSINYSYIINNNTTTSTQAYMNEKLRDLNSNELLLNARRKVHLNEELTKEFKTSLPKEPKLFHFHPVAHSTNMHLNGFKSTPHLASSLLIDNTTNQQNTPPTGAQASTKLNKGNDNATLLKPLIHFNPQLKPTHSLGVNRHQLFTNYYASLLDQEKMRQRLLFPNNQQQQHQHQWKPLQLPTFAQHQPQLQQQQQNLLLNSSFRRAQTGPTDLLYRSNSLFDFNDPTVELNTIKSNYNRSINSLAEALNLLGLSTSATKLLGSPRDPNCSVTTTTTTKPHKPLTNILIHRLRKNKRVNSLQSNPSKTRTS